MSKKMLGMALFLLTSCKSEKNFMDQLREKSGYVKVNNVHEACLVYPKTVEEMVQRVEKAKELIARGVSNILMTPQAEQNKQTMIHALDALVGATCEISILEFVQHVYPDTEMQQKAAVLSTELQDYYTDLVEMNVDLYKAFKTYDQNNAQTEDLTQEERYFLKEALEDFQRAGLDLPEEKLKKALGLRKKLNKIGQDFSLNISADASHITATREQLEGVTEDFIAGLTKNDDGLYVINTDYPSQNMIMNYCSVEDTRKRFICAFKDRAYPQNKEVLDSMLDLRDEYAKLLGYESFAALDLSDQMIKTVERAWDFENDLKNRSLEKAKAEFKKMVADLPEGVALTDDGILNSWNSAYVSTYFKKKHYDIDERELAEYFPMEKTVAGLMNIYETFFSLKIRYLKPEHVWHEEVKLLEISDAATGELLGYVFLDMFPRKGKFNHAAEFEAIPAMHCKNGTRYPAVVAVVCNFTKPTADKPSLLTYREVDTFFHEFGHAIHSVLGATRLASQSGTHVKQDFVELPSQMLENWLEDRDIVKNLSCHYKTGEQMPDRLLDQKLKLLKFGLGMETTAQLMLGMVSLEFYGEGTDKDTDQIWKKYGEMLIPYIAYDQKRHPQYSFGHLFSYGPKYYGYLWSKVLGQDVFAEIEKGGLLNPTVGKKYVECILSKGGSKDPNELLIDFLGREPNSDAFFKKMGL